MRARGFTLVELITVMVLIGILSVTALPRFFERNAFEARGFFDETMAQLRYAQKAAIAQRRRVCVDLAAGGVGLAIDSNSDGVCNQNDNVLVLPNAASRGGAGLAATSGGAVLAGFQFDSLGGTTLAADAIISIANHPGTITVDRNTGYVY